ncbi:MAG: YggS family pyridoxal phosphate enzyme [Pelagibacteraceae bacterium TMED287]|nr:MAG: YggS family pyridoxal phosphate enzyme [Pelagibacteraceae bacterium TMED287]|tara:strand:- start:207 stop:857 length:651 start_codon:yes stop_codon:yes gene_type:complete
MNTIVDRYNKIKSFIDTHSHKAKIVAISKTFDINHIKPIIELGHLHFGENKVQEAEKKWKPILSENKNIKLHMVGKLQSNKAKKAVEIFHYVHSLDNQKLAKTLSIAQENSGKQLNYFIQVNVGEENQKSGLSVKEVNDFYEFCLKETNLKIIGLMVIPPNDGNEEKYFKLINQLNMSLNFSDLSMGMSGDFKIALNFNSSFLRIGSAIFGERIRK